MNKVRMYKTRMYKAGMSKVMASKAICIKAGLVVLLMTQSMALQADQDDTQNQSTAAGSGSEERSVGGQQAGNLYADSLPQMQRQQNINELIPPPPPGPYKSTALRDDLEQARAYGHSVQKPVRRLEPTAMPMEMYSPDRPWPGHLRPSDSRMPDGRHHFSTPPVTENPYPAAMQNMPPAGNYGYRSGPMMGSPGNWPGMNASESRWMPSMGGGPRNLYPTDVYPRGAYPEGSYPVPPNGYRRNYGAEYNTPVNSPPYYPQGRR